MTIVIKKWVEEHIPHRVRGVLVGTGLYREFHSCATLWPVADPVQLRFITDAAWEARIICLRWLIEFIGITGDKSGVKRAARKSFDPITNDVDVGIEHINPKALYPTNGTHAIVFAETWLAASKASAHGTADKHHLCLQDVARNVTAKAVIVHLTDTVYGRSDQWLSDFVFRPPS